MQPDVIELVGNSTIQHGPYNDRIYLMKAHPADVETLPDKLKAMAESRGYSKVFAKVRENHAERFRSAGFKTEASIPGFFNGSEAVLMLSYFLNDSRQVSATAERNQEVIGVCREKATLEESVGLPANAELRICEPNDAEAMAELYRQVFPTYPFPIDDPGYVRETMASHIVYFGIWIEGKLVALSSSEMDVDSQNVEMTDFATLPECRGKGFASILLQVMEQEMKRREIATAFTIARAPSFGMNITFARLGYDFGGRLINNTNIGGQFEDMNVWHKDLRTVPVTELSKADDAIRFS